MLPTKLQYKPSIGMKKIATYLNQLTKEKNNKIMF